MIAWAPSLVLGRVQPAFQTVHARGIQPVQRAYPPSTARPLWMLAEGAAAVEAAAAAADAELIEEQALDGVVCARGVCVVADNPGAAEVCYLDEDDNKVKCSPNPDVDNEAEKQWWPSALLLGCSVLYGTNFPLGRLMNEALPASATSSARFLMAAIALSPFLLQLNPAIRMQALRCGTFTAIGYISQSIAVQLVESAVCPV